MARKKIIAGNWKMSMTPSEAVKLVETLKPLVVNDEVDVVFCVPAIDIIPVVEAAKGTNIQVGAENMYFEEKGAYTGEISPNMLVDAGVKYVVLGHSERREYFAETSETVNKKNAESFRARHHPDHVLRRNSGAERAGCNDGLHSSAGKGWIPECNSRSGQNSRYRLRANLGNRNRQKLLQQSRLRKFAKASASVSLKSMMMQQQQLSVSSMAAL